MSIIEKVFHYEENEITVIKCRDDIWFGGKDIAKAIGYKAILPVNGFISYINLC